MKKLLILPLLLLTSCITMVPKEKLDKWALSNGYILAENCPKIEIPERSALPHPSVPTIQVQDSNGNYVPITEAFLMKTIVSLFGTVEKFQYLVEIYEREYLNSGEKIMPDLSLDELKQMYLNRVKEIDNITKSSNLTSNPTQDNIILDDKSSNMTIDEFLSYVNMYNYFQELGE